MPVSHTMRGVPFASRRACTPPLCPTHTGARRIAAYSVIYNSGMAPNSSTTEQVFTDAERQVESISNHKCQASAFVTHVAETMIVRYRSRWRDYFSPLQSKSKSMTQLKTVCFKALWILPCNAIRIGQCSAQFSSPGS